MADGKAPQDKLRLGGMALPELLRAESNAGVRKGHKAVIMIFLPGGPSHQDMFDLKMDAPSEIRGEFQPIKTNVSGIEICELFPRIAAMMASALPSSSQRMTRAIIRAAGICTLARSAESDKTPSRLHQMASRCAGRDREAQRTQ